jgi:hypothetical protein
MAVLQMTSVWERLLIPAYVYFFKLLYPFRLSNSRGRLVAAAAGGCVLVEAESTCTVYGMPRAVAEAGLADEILPLDELADAIVREAGR